MSRGIPIQKQKVKYWHYSDEVKLLSFTLNNLIKRSHHGGAVLKGGTLTLYVVIWQTG
ncbi:hypothetical protein D3C84_287680 [compost metagenome]